MIYKTLGCLILPTPSAILFLFWLHSNYAGLLRYPQIPPRGLCICCSLYLQSFCKVFHVAGSFSSSGLGLNIISSERSSIPDHVNLTLPGILSWQLDYLLRTYGGYRKCFAALQMPKCNCPKAFAIALCNPPIHMLQSYTSHEMLPPNG